MIGCSGGCAAVGPRTNQVATAHTTASIFIASEVYQTKRRQSRTRWIGLSEDDVKKMRLRHLVYRPPRRARSTYLPSGVVISVPVGGVKSNIDTGSGARLWFE